jgi:peptide/nickel transport system ATP-binding protein
MPKTEYDGPILEIDKLSISFFTRLREIPAVMDFSVSVQPGEAVGLVGESGCGKSTVALGVMQDLGKNGRIVGGSIKFKGRDLQEMSAEELRDIRGSDLSGTHGIAEPSHEDRQTADGSAHDPSEHERKRRL